MKKEDLLGRKDFIDMLEMVISTKVNNQEGLSIAIDGKWGCGKSFIVRELEARLNGLGYLVVHYNCWQNDYYEEPLIAILSVLVDALNNLKTPKTIRDKKTQKTKKIAVTLLKSLLFSLLKNKLGVDLGEVKEALGKALSEDQADLFCKDFDCNQPLKETIRVVQGQLLNIKLEWKGVVFVVDELDRCTPRYAMKVLERLHHICYDVETDKFQFVQFVAMNRDELCYGISKAYGKDQLVLDDSSNKKITKMGSVPFGNYYLQKFIQMVIPVPAGNSEKSIVSVLNGFESNFNTDDAEKMQLVVDLLNICFKDVSMRILEETIEFARIVHEITLINNKDGNVGKDKPTLIALCVEIIDCFCRAIVKTELPTVFTTNLSPSGNVVNVKDQECATIEFNCRKEFVNDLESFGLCVKDFFANECYQHASDPFSSRLQKTQYWVRKNKTSAYILLFYFSKRKDTEWTLEDSNYSHHEVDRRFIEKFRETLNILAPAKV